jgi:ribosome-binding factor A
VTRREEKIISFLKHLLSEYLLNLNFKDKIISITNLEISKDLKFAKIYISVYPEKEEEEILKTIKKEKNEIKKYISSHAKMKFLPELDFFVDKGEKNRRRIEELLQK